MVDKDKELDFIDEDDEMVDGKEDETALGEIKKGEEANIVNIVVKNLVNKY